MRGSFITTVSHGGRIARLYENGRLLVLDGDVWRDVARDPKPPLLRPEPARWHDPYSR